MTTIESTTAKEMWNSVWEAIEAGKLDDLDDLFAEDAVFRTSSAQGTGREYAKGVMTRHVQSYPDLSREVIETVESADSSTVVVELNFTGTHRGALVHPDGSRIEPTGRTLTWRAIDKVTVRDGKVVQWAAMFDRLSLLQQLS